LKASALVVLFFSSLYLVSMSPTGSHEHAGLFWSQTERSVKSSGRLWLMRTENTLGLGTRSVLLPGFYTGCQIHGRRSWHRTGYWWLLRRLSVSQLGTPLRCPMVTQRMSIRFHPYRPVGLSRSRPVNGDPLSDVDRNNHVDEPDETLMLVGFEGGSGQARVHGADGSRR